MSQIHSLQLPGTLFVLPEVSLAANQDDWCVPTEVLHLWVPLGKQNREFNGVIQYMSVISPIRFLNYLALLCLFAALIGPVL